MKLPFTTPLITAMLAFQTAHANTISITVKNTADNGMGSLRQALHDAGPGATVDFAPGLTGTITLTSGELEMNYVNILGPGANVITIDGNGNDRVFDCFSTNNYISGLTITNGQGFDIDQVGRIQIDRGGGGIYLPLGNGNFGPNVLTVSNCTICGNVTYGTVGGDTSAGGGIYNAGTLTVYNSTFFGNVGQYGGAIYNIGTLTNINCTFADNTAANVGGAIDNDYNYYPGDTYTGHASIQSCTIVSNYDYTDNLDTYGGGVYAGRPCDASKLDPRHQLRQRRP